MSLSVSLPPVAGSSFVRTAPAAGWRSPAVLRAVFWLPLLLVAVFYLAASAGPAVFNQNEAQYAGAAREMLNRPQDYQPSARAQAERGQWLVPTNDGIPRLQKPPLVYWLLIASMRLFGVNDFSARLPNALASLAWFAGIVFLGRRLAQDPAHGLRHGVAGATVLATMAGTFIFSHLIAPEPFLAAFLTWTFWCLLSACRQPARADGFLRLAWVLMSLGALTKGLHAVLYPLAVAGVLAWRHPATRPVWRRLFRPPGLLILAVILVPWYAYVEHKYPGFLRDQLFNEQVGHVLNRRYPPDSNAVPLPVFVLEHLILFLPWTFFIPAAWRAGRSRGTAGWDRLGRDLLLAWFAVTFASLLFSSLQDYYLLTAFGPVALWLARPWLHDSRPENSLPRWMLAGPGLALGAVGLLVLGFGVFLRLRGVDISGATNSDGERDQILATIEGFSAAAWSSLLPLVWTAGLAFLVGGTVAVFLASRGRRPAVVACTAVMMLAVLAVAQRGMCVLEDYFSLKKVCLLVKRLAGPGASLVCFGPTINSPSLLYYLDREVYWLGANPDGEFASRELRINRALFLTERTFAQRWSGAAPVFLCVEEADFARLPPTVAFTPEQREPLAQFGTTLLITNHPLSK